MSWLSDELRAPMLAARSCKHNLSLSLSKGIPMKRHRSRHHRSFAHTTPGWRKVPALYLGILPSCSLKRHLSVVSLPTLSPRSKTLLFCLSSATDSQEVLPSPQPQPEAPSSASDIRKEGATTITAIASPTFLGMTGRGYKG